MTPIEIIFAIREKLKEYVDDTRFTDDYLLYLVDLKRATLLKQKYNRIQRQVDEQILQSVALEMVEEDASDFTAVPLEFGYDIVKSKLPLPKILDLDHKNVIERISTVGKLDIPINIVSRRRFTYAGTGDYDRDQFFAMMDNEGYIYIKGTTEEHRNYDYISVTALFERPMEVLDLITNNSDKDVNDFKYPCKNELVDIIIDMIVQQLANIKSLPSDEDNNASDDATQINNGQK